MFLSIVMMSFMCTWKLLTKRIFNGLVVVINVKIYKQWKKEFELIF